LIVTPSVDGETNFGVRADDEAVGLFGMKITNAAGAEPCCTDDVVVVGVEPPPPALHPAMIARDAISARF
jgi:hypothetical protein